MHIYEKENKVLFDKYNQSNMSKKDKEKNRGK